MPWVPYRVVARQVHAFPRAWTPHSSTYGSQRLPQPAATLRASAQDVAKPARSDRAAARIPLGDLHLWLGEAVAPAAGSAASSAAAASSDGSLRDMCRRYSPSPVC